jgi:hypothetical protein
MRKTLIVCSVVALFSIVLTSVFQPFTHLQAWAQQGNCQTFKETGHTVCGRFLLYWQQHGALAQQGFPISPEFSEVSDLDNRAYTVQYFERAVFEYHPENQAPYDVLLSQLGTFRFSQKYPGGVPGLPTPLPTPPPPPPGPGVNVPIRDGVTMTLLESDRTGIADGFCGLAMYWHFEIRNSSRLPVTLELDRSSLAETDNTGKTYSPISCALSCLPTCGLESPATIPSSGSISFRTAFDVKNLPANVTYFDLKVRISGTQLVFRYQVK